MHKNIKLGQFIETCRGDCISLDGDISIHPKLLIWSPVHDFWILNDGSWEFCYSKKELKFLLKQPISFIRLRDKTPEVIYVYLKDYGEQKNKKLKIRLGKK